MRNRSAVPPVLRPGMVVSGRKIEFSPDPPTVVASPWNTITVVFSATTPAAATILITPTDIATALARQLGYSMISESLEFRLIFVKAWLVDATKLDLAMQVYDLFNSTFSSANQRMYTLADVSAQNHFAHVGWEWSLPQQNVVLDQTNTAPLVEVGAITGSPLRVHLRILWRFNRGGTPLSTIATELASLKVT
jgi:hypothetical protein